MEAWYQRLTQENALEPQTAAALEKDGYVMVQGPLDPGALSVAYDRAVATANPADVSIRSSTRISDFVNRGVEFDGVYTFPPLLAACCQIFKRPFKLSTMLGRTLEPGTPPQPLHVDVRRGSDGWPLIGFILMVDDFTETNGATEFVAGSHRWRPEPKEVCRDEVSTLPALGDAGAMLIFNGSVWHGHGANSSGGRRRSIQGAFIPRDARSATDHRRRLQAGTHERISDLAKYLLELTEAGGSE